MEGFSQETPEQNRPIREDHSEWGPRARHLFAQYHALGFTHGGYYLITGLWPIVSMNSFLAVTGPKVELWLVRTVGLLVAVIGTQLLISTAAQRTREMVFLGVGAASALIAIEIVYVIRGQIPPIYLLDTAIEIALIAWWAYAWRANASTSASSQSFTYSS